MHSTENTSHYLGLSLAFAVVSWLLLQSTGVEAADAKWQGEWPNAYLSSSIISFREIKEGRPPNEGMLALNRAIFSDPVGPHLFGVGQHEPVITLVHDTDARTYMLNILNRYEIVDDVAGEHLGTVAYSPLCNTPIVFGRALDGQVYEFGTTGKLPNSDLVRISNLVMYDRQTESWLEEFSGEPIVSDFSGRTFHILPSRLEAITLVRAYYPDGELIQPAYDDPSAYYHPYEGYDQSHRPFRFSSSLPIVRWRMSLQ